MPQLRCVMASECRFYAAHHAEIAPSKTAAATLCRLQSSIHHQFPRPARHSRPPPRRQITIDGHRPRRPPRVPSLEAFGRRPPAPVDRPRRAGIRNPSHPRPNAQPKRAAVVGRFDSLTQGRPDGGNVALLSHFKALEPIAAYHQSGKPAAEVAVGSTEATTDIETQITAPWAMVGPSPASRVCLISRSSCGSNRRPRCIVERLSHITKSLIRQTCE